MFLRRINSLLLFFFFQTTTTMIMHNTISVTVNPTSNIDSCDKEWNLFVNPFVIFYPSTIDTKHV